MRDDVDVKKFGSNLRIAARDSGFKFSQFAKKIGTNRGTLQSWWWGVYLPRSETLYKMSRILGVSMEKLMEGVVFYDEEDNG